MPNKRYKAAWARIGMMLSLFLDFLLEQALRNPDELESYTEVMAAEDDEVRLSTKAWVNNSERDSLILG